MTNLKDVDSFAIKCWKCNIQHYSGKEVKLHTCDFYWSSLKLHKKGVDHKIWLKKRH